MSGASSTRPHWSIRRLFFNAAFWGGILLWSLVFIPFSPFIWLWLFVGKGHGSSVSVALRILIHIYGQGVCTLMASLVPLRLSFAQEKLPQPCIITLNHQSFFDPYCIGFLPVQNLVFFVRSWPFRIPVYGRLMPKVGYLNTDSLSAEELFDKAGTLLREGCAVVIFPEGTRSPDGRLGRFRAGAFILSMKTGVPIVPVCLDGTGRVFPKGSRFGQPAPIRIHVLAPVRPDAFQQFGDTGHLHLRRQVKTAMQSALEG